MLSGLLLLSIAVMPQEGRPTDGLLRIENLDCVSSNIPADKAQIYYDMTRDGRERDAFLAAGEATRPCQQAHQWTDLETRNAFRVALMDGWLLHENLIEKIRNLGDFMPFLDKFYTDNAAPDGRHLLEAAYRSGKVDRELTEAGYPEDPELRRLAHDYWEWRGTLRMIEDDFRNGILGR
ncbi:hypothetical protein [Sphingorhabdus sp. 109]|jgi:hypothetical protein|uniref:hypothetical protein n=1 Tax=Sphingorhabdus sp. 109 TaxID=2653173 RepID=UPI0012EF9CA9|nr:hypothetical protein [Sphingorhabdus sp. 109]VWX56986.1 conserved hypothetical protein [Sphingorhabdus sp. 109]